MTCMSKTTVWTELRDYQQSKYIFMKTNIEETQNGEVRGSILFCYFPFILLLKHITFV